MKQKCKKNKKEQNRKNAQQILTTTRRRKTTNGSPTIGGKQTYERSTTLQSVHLCCVRARVFVSVTPHTK